jgi:hypothetical protein
MVCACGYHPAIASSSSLSPSFTWPSLLLNLLFTSLPTSLPASQRVFFLSHIILNFRHHNFLFFSHIAADILNKIFKKKIKRSKAGGAEDEEDSEEDEEDEADDEVSRFTDTVVPCRSIEGQILLSSRGILISFYTHNRTTSFQFVGRGGGGGRLPSRMRQSSLRQVLRTAMRCHVTSHHVM